MPSFCYIEERREGEVVCVRPLQEVLIGDAAGATAQELYRLAEQPDCLRLLLDLSGVARLSSEMFGKLIMLHKRMLGKKGRLAVFGLAPNIHEIFEQTKLDQIFTLCRDASEGLAALRQ